MAVIDTLSRGKITCWGDYCSEIYESVYTSIHIQHVPLAMAYLLQDMVESCLEFPPFATKVSQYFESTLEKIEAQKNIIDKFI